ncbi:hypothetical protein [Pedobacter sp. SL55]|uniref:hypothetical protein n=1 Tax=Pedobacter sp. SL55 TaxID=2995161 RepID=UPI0022715C81|nr:hypothetical protein [Pedobacter sp. SL55]WAC39437.1 hypothetical protein OVA16_12615 [Pedobacter sp. SL55]
MFIEKTNSSLVINESTLFADGVIYINNEQWLLAYSTFAYLCKSNKERSIALLYNMALCHQAAQEYAEAIALLNTAKMQLKSTAVLSHQNKVPSIHLLTDEYHSEHYRLALSEAAVALNANIIKLRIQRLLLDLHIVLENWEEAVRLSALPDMDKCKNVQEALILIKSKTTT